MFVSADISTLQATDPLLLHPEYTSLSDCLLGEECGVGKGKTAAAVEKLAGATFLQGIKASITRGVFGCHAQSLMCQAGQSSFAFLPPNLRAQSHHKIIRKAQTGGHPSGHNPVLLKALMGQEKIKKN